MFVTLSHRYFGPLYVVCINLINEIKRIPDFLQNTIYRKLSIDKKYIVMI